MDDVMDKKLEKLKLPHIVLLDTSVMLEQGQTGNLIKEHEKSFYNESTISFARSHGDEMLDVLSGHLNCDVKISIGKVINNAGEGSVMAFSHGLNWAAELYPDIVVIPTGIEEANSSIKAALEILENTHCRIFASVGNCADDQYGCLYPAAYPECISVGSSGSQRDYNDWAKKPDIIVNSDKAISGTLTVKQFDTAGATMLAVAEYVNHNFLRDRLSASS